MLLAQLLVRVPHAEIAILVAVQVALTLAIFSVHPAFDIRREGMTKTSKYLGVGLGLTGLVLALAYRLHAPEVINLEYDRQLSSIGFPNPLLRATMNGQTVWFIIDTGAGVHTLASWLVGAAGLKTSDSNSTTTGSTGTVLKTRVIRDAGLYLVHQRRKIALREAIVVDFPQVFAEQRIGGLISPQLLAPAGKSARLDLGLVPRLTFGSPFEASKGMHVCTNGESQFTNRLYAAEVSAGNVKALVLVDTGATSTVIASSSSVATSFADRTSGQREVQGLGGGVTTANKFKPIEFRFAGSTRILSPSVGRSSPSCGPDGLLAMDALRECVLNLGESSFAWSCR
jgi:hypothetical protein